MAAAPPPRIYPPWQTKCVRSGATFKGAHCLLFTQHVHREAEFADTHGECAPSSLWMAFLTFCMEAFRRIQCPETRHTTLLVEQVVDEETFRDALARGKCEVTPARPPRAWRFWVIFKTVDAYVQFAATFEQMLEEGAIASKKWQGTRKGGPPRVDPTSWVSIGGSDDIMRGLQHTCDIPGGASSVALDPTADTGAKNHIFNLQSPELLHVGGACSAQTGRSYIDRPTNQPGIFDAGDDDSGPSLTFRAPYSRTGDGRTNPFLALFSSAPWGRKTDNLRHMVYLGTPTPARLLEKHLLNRATGPDQAALIRKHADSNTLDEYLANTPDVNDPRDAGIVTGDSDSGGAVPSRSAAMAPEFGQNEESASPRMRALRVSTEPLADQVKLDAGIAPYVAKLQGPIRFLKDAAVPDAIPSSYHALATAAAATARGPATDATKWAGAFFDDCQTTSDFMRRLSVALERYAGLHVAQVTVCNWVILAIMAPLLGPAPRAHTALVGQPAAGKSWTTDVLRKILPTMFSSVDYTSLKAHLVDMLGGRKIQLTDEIAKSERVSGEKTRLSSGEERGIRATVVTDANGNSKVVSNEFVSIWNDTQLQCGNQPPRGDTPIDTLALQSRQQVIHCANPKGFASGTPRLHDQVLLAIRMFLTGAPMQVGYIWAAGCPVASSDMMEVLQAYRRVKGMAPIAARELSRLRAAAIGAMSLRMGIETRGMEGIATDEYIVRNAYVRTEDIVIALQTMDAVAQSHAGTIVLKALKNMVNVNVERDADGNITGAAVETDNKGERAILTQAMTPKWFDRLVATVCAIAKRDDREMVPADDVLRRQLQEATSGARPIVLECIKGESRPALGIDLKQVGPVYTKTEAAMIKFLHAVCKTLAYTAVRYPDENHVILGSSIIEDMRQPHPTCRKWGPKVEKMWTRAIKSLDETDVQLSVARLIASGDIVLDRVIECKYVRSAEGGRPSKLKPGFDVESAGVIKRHQAAVVRLPASASADKESLTKEFAADTDPSLEGRTFQGMAQMYGQSVAESARSGTFTVRYDASRRRVRLPDRNYIPPDENDLPTAPGGSASIFDGSSPYVDATTVNERARHCHLMRIFHNLSLAPLPATAGTKRRSTESEEDGRPVALKAARCDAGPAQPAVDPESDIESELDWAERLTPGDEDSMHAE